MPPSGRLATMRVWSRPQRAHLARRERASQGPQIRPSGLICRSTIITLPQLAHPGRTTGCPASCRMWARRSTTGGQQVSPEVSASGWEARWAASSSRIRAGPLTGIGTAAIAQLTTVLPALNTGETQAVLEAAVPIPVRGPALAAPWSAGRSPRPSRPPAAPPGGRAGRPSTAPSQPFGFPDRGAAHRWSGAGGVPGGLADPGAGGLDLDEVVRGAAQDVAQRREGVHRQALRRLGDQPEHLLAGQADAAFGQQRHQVGGLEHIGCRHELAQVPAITHLLDHGWPSSQSPAWRSVSFRCSSRLRYSSETPV